MTEHERHASIPVTAEFLADAGFDFDTYLRDAFHRVLYPWEYPDRPIGFTFEPFPRWTRFTRRLRRLDA